MGRRAAGAELNGTGGRHLLLGPLLRRVDDDGATIWVETSQPATVTVLGSSADTFTVNGRHYAVVVVRDLPAEPVAYEVLIDDRTVWPPDDGPDATFPAPIIDPVGAGAPVTIVAGSCLNAAPHDGVHDADPADGQAAVGPDALHTLAHEVARGERARPDLLVLVGDQVYADDDPTGAQDGPLRRFAEHADLYRQAWSEPAIRWLLSTVPSTMIWDDHEVVDDWNISAAWADRAHAEPDWDDRVGSALGAYWVHQHLGNLSVDELDEEPVLAEIRALDDGWPALRRHALGWDRGTAGTDGARWSHHRSVGDVEVVLVDSRNGRLLGDERWMHDEEERRWLEDRIRTSAGRHLVLASSVPILLPPGLHGVERWNEALCAGAWGRWAARWSERLRQDIDLEHWAAFSRSFDWLEDLLIEVADAPDPPRSITLLSGDVHFAYVAPATHAGRLVATQVVASPMRNRISPKQERQLRLGTSRLVRLASRLLRRSTGDRAPRLRWELAEGPVFDNNVLALTFGETVEATLHVARSGRRALAPSFTWAHGG